MKKITSILLVLVILLSFSGCKKEELNEDNIVDTWKAEISVENFSLITGMKIAGNGTELPSEYIKKINSFELPLYIIFNENGTTFDATLDALEVTFLGLFEKTKQEFLKDFGEPDKNGYYTANKKPEKFTVNEDSITIITEKDKEEITYCKLTDKDTLVVNKIYCDFEDSEVNITFKRVK